MSNIPTSRCQENIQTLPAFFFSWDVECVPGKINTNLPHKIRNANKRDDIAAKLVPKSLHIQHKMLFGNKHKAPMKKGNL